MQPGATLKSFIEIELAAHKAARQHGHVMAAWKSLERAHILSQGDVWLHTKVHWLMLTYATTLRDWREVLGQIVRIAVAGIGTALGRAPRGNTERSIVPLFATMDVPQDIEATLGRMGLDRKS